MRLASNLDGDLSPARSAQLAQAPAPQCETRLSPQSKSGVDTFDKDARTSLNPAPAAAALAAPAAVRRGPTPPTSLPPLTVDGIDEFAGIVGGGGTAGCLVAYLLAKWMQEFSIPGTVLLLERGAPYEARGSSRPELGQWFQNWERFSQIHPSTWDDGTPYPISGSDHVGLGGCGVHDTRISFVPTQTQRAKMATMLGWTTERFDEYIQAILNMIPLERAVGSERFYDAVLQRLDENGILKRVPDDEYKAQVLTDTIAHVSVAMFPNRMRWTSAYLLSDGIRPSNLKVVTGAVLERIALTQEADQLRATGVVVQHNGRSEVARLSEHGEVALTAGSLDTPPVLFRSGIGPEWLARLGIHVVVDADVGEEVGHGVDHIEVPVSHRFLDAWREADGSLPTGGVMQWPSALFAKLDDVDALMMAHFGLSAPPYTHGVFATPNLMRPDPEAGFHVIIDSTDPQEPARLVHHKSDADVRVMLAGVRKMFDIFNVLQRGGIVGERLAPPPEVDINDDAALYGWISKNMWTVYHWMSTCKAGVQAKTVDGQFRMRASARTVIENLRIGSGASMPEITEPNPHVTIGALSIALAHMMLETQQTRHGMPKVEPTDVRRARETLAARRGELTIRRAGEEQPDLSAIAARHKAMVEAA